MKRLCVVVVSCLVAVSCGGSPTSPDDNRDGFIDGVWTGTLTITQAGQLPVTGATTWTFRTVPNTGGTTYTATIQSQNPWIPGSITASTALTPPATAPAQVSTQGNYPSPRGCNGTFGSTGTAETRRLTATFHGVDCGSTFEGTVELSR
jgi:hypothetical protein